MGKTEITSIALKFFAMYVFSNCLFTLPTALWIQATFINIKEIAGEPVDGQILGWIIGGSVIVIATVLAIFLWKLSNSLVNENNNSRDAVTSINADEIERIVIVGIGLFFVVDAIPYFGHSVVSIFDFPGAKYREGINYPEILRTIFNIVQIAVAVSFIVAPIWWRGLFRKAQSKLSSNNSPQSDA
jgi:hypothetical protein